MINLDLAKAITHDFLFKLESSPDEHKTIVQKEESGKMMLYRFGITPMTNAEISVESCVLVIVLSLDHAEEFDAFLKQRLAPLEAPKTVLPDESTAN